MQDVDKPEIEQHVDAPEMQQIAPSTAVEVVEDMSLDEEVSLAFRFSQTEQTAPGDIFKCIF